MYTEFKKQLSLPLPSESIDRSNYRGISLLPTTYKILSNILPSRLIPYAEEIIKGKAIPLQAWTCPEGSRRFRLPDFKTIGT
jgi:hypothetical protein